MSTVAGTPTARAVAPDLARGAMLLMIALANVHLYLYGSAGLRGYPADLGPVDQLVAVFQLLFVDGRAYPLFAMLVGYGAVQSARGREPGRGVGILRRRGAWMIAIGALHGVLLFSADIVGAYGLLLLLSAGILVRGSERTLRAIALAGLLLTGAVGATSGLSSGPAWPSMTATDPALAVVLHLAEWLGSTVVSVLTTVGMVALGALAARRGILDEPGRYRPLLRRTAATGIAVAAVTGLPLALAAAGWWQPATGSALVAGVLHQAGGLAGGIGFGALFGLLATRVAPQPLLATGRRSLSNYLGQSVVFCGLLPAWSLGLGTELTVWQASLLGVATWLLGIAISTALDRAGRRGPAEVVLRRLTYGGRPARTG
ncbi:hypothetical protein AD006_29440 (plasmid) [Pseudonocardia sp. EC080610-09]|uniref:DUF418 domain-containing protein n=1 Tax=unclassified Pseudonocardia TaxID=2619320 RepID=UPI000705C2E5|nr:MULTISPECIES: DUF418 domain-containing protein [unclassified Pseudonocardia]ALL79400.1 hypothetical protein AD006_29440 [Pseudonocardia sp. EC080610-09]ALL85646.1 hypothetical protein AD017_31810 [Pseudonocardia sp. EC080619-01]